MTEKAFTFDGHVSEETYKPFVPWDAFKQLKPDQILIGVVDHVTPTTPVKAQVLINGHLTGIAVWGEHAFSTAANLVGRSVRIRFKGMKEKDGKEYPELQLML